MAQPGGDGEVVGTEVVVASWEGVVIHCLSLAIFLGEGDRAVGNSSDNWLQVVVMC